jgi:sigma-B regulation protein RsbU (phosphoserine phosphatase)
MASYELNVEPQVAEIARLLDWVEACCGAERVPDEIRYKIMLALEEAVTNVIKNAFAGIPPPHLIRVRLDVTQALFAAEVIDNGRAFDPTSAPEPDLTLPLEQRIPGGLGIHLMRNIVDRLHYTHGAGHNTLRLEKAR